ncbi:MAG TPA: isoprenyl transferase [Verrucomicrobiae bacterium]|nr:isoprenyl transferase [Verrucomicrobiae bacterium]
MLEELKKEIRERGNLPGHIAIIMDGNGRWAKQKNLPRTEGHKAGVEAIRKVVRTAGEMGIQYLTLFAFSTENWRRPKEEVAALMQLLSDTARKELKEMMDNNLRLKTTGDIEGLPYAKRLALHQAIKKTSRNTGIILNLALNYSGRSEILAAVRKIAREVKEGKLSPSRIDEKVFESHLYTKGLPDPDLLIRTSGEKRLSNFMLWQAAYTELYITETLWPDFGEKEFLMALADYQNRQRRFGRV